MPHAALCVSRRRSSIFHGVEVAVSMPHAALCVSRQLTTSACRKRIGFNAARSIVYVETVKGLLGRRDDELFQCRTQHCVCRDIGMFDEANVLAIGFQCRTQHCVCRDELIDPFGGQEDSFNAARSIVCVETTIRQTISERAKVSMPHAALCVSRQQELAALEEELDVSMPHAALCVSRRRAATSPISRSGGFNAARSIVCVETLCPAALVPRGLRRHFGKTRFFAPFLASADELCPEKWGSHRRCPLCGAGCTVLERRNGGMRLCARAGALSISFSSYLMIAHASFFFNDVFASMQRGR